TSSSVTWPKRSSTGSWIEDVHERRKARRERGPGTGTDIPPGGMPDIGQRSTQAGAPRMKAPEAGPRRSWKRRFRCFVEMLLALGIATDQLALLILSPLRDAANPLRSVKTL